MSEREQKEWLDALLHMFSISNYEMFREEFLKVYVGFLNNNSKCSVNVNHDIYRKIKGLNFSSTNDQLLMVCFVGFYLQNDVDAGLSSAIITFLTSYFELDNFDIINKQNSQNQLVTKFQRLNKTAIVSYGYVSGFIEGSGGFDHVEDVNFSYQSFSMLEMFKLLSDGAQSLVSSLLIQSSSVSVRDVKQQFNFWVIGLIGALDHLKCSSGANQLRQFLNLNDAPTVETVSRVSQIFRASTSNFIRPSDESSSQQSSSRNINQANVI